MAITMAGWGGDTFPFLNQPLRGKAHSDLYVYDFENHLIQHGTQPGAVTIVYDGDGDRVSETVAGVTRQYLVDMQSPSGYAQVVDELQNGAVTKTYSYGLERISQNWQPTTGKWQPGFYGYDGHGSVRFLTDSTGAVTDTYDYDAFGNLTNSTGSTPNNYLFAGEQYDPALGLYYNRARYLNTATGRFWSMDDYDGDPSSPSSLHKYLYASGNPASRIDPTGNEDIAELAEVGAVQSVLQSMAMMSLRGALLGGLFGAVDAALQNKPGKEILLAAAKAGLIGAVLGPLTKIKFVAPVLVALGTTSGVAGTVDAIEQKNFGLASFRAAATFVGFRTFVEEPIQSGGRLGTADTRYQLSQYAKFLESRGWTITGGGGVAPEEYLPGSGPGTQGGNFLDLTAQKNGITLRINTVTTLSDGVTPTTDEAAAAALIRSKIDPNDPFILIPKWSLPDWYQPTK